MINKHVSTESRCYIHLFHRSPKPMDTVSINTGALKREISRLTGKHLHILKTSRHWAQLYLPFRALWEALPLLRFVCVKRLLWPVCLNGAHLCLHPVWLPFFLKDWFRKSLDTVSHCTATRPSRMPVLFCLLQFSGFKSITRYHCYVESFTSRMLRQNSKKAHYHVFESICFFLQTTVIFCSNFSDCIIYTVAVFTQECRNQSIN
jgi:hypothetical protein